jgi:hypothetical protein
MRTMGLVATSLATLLALSGLAGADDTEPDASEPGVSADEAELYVEAPGGHLAVDRDEGKLELEAGDTRVYADETGRLDVRAPGLTIRARPN